MDDNDETMKDDNNNDTDDKNNDGDDNNNQDEDKTAKNAWERLLPVECSFLLRQQPKKAEFP